MIAILVLIPIVIIALISIVHPYVYKITGKYYFIATLAFCFFLYFFIVRYLPDANYAVHHLQELKNKNEQYQYSFYFSKILLLDLCPLTTALITLSLIFDPTKNIAKVIAPLGMIGSVVTLFGGVPMDIASKHLEWKEFANYIFLGVYNGDTLNRLYYMMHLMLLIISWVTLLNAKQFTKWSMLGAHLFFLGFLIYAITLSRCLNITNNVTGLVENDWYGGGVYNQYGAVYNMLPMSFPGIIFFWYFVAAIAHYTICFVKNYFTSDCFKLSYCNKKFYQKWKHQGFLYKIMWKTDIWYDTLVNKIKEKCFC